MNHKDPTPKQVAERKRIDERNRRLQDRGVKAPKSGTFGGKPTTPKGSDRGR